MLLYSVLKSDKRTDILYIIDFVAPHSIQMQDGKQLVSTWQATNPIREQID